MKTTSSLVMALALLTLTANAQNLYPKKDLAFAQVAAGGGYETFLNVTNRGSSTYNGSLNLYTGIAQPWSPFVNGSPITNGQLNISISKGATATYRITRSGGMESGFAVILATDLSLSSFLEGTLTYYVGSGAIFVDSVGVQPSSEVYLTAVPFDDFSRLAMALVNVNESGVTVKLTVYSETNARVAALDVPLASGEHRARYLWQLFPGLQIMGGRLEVQSEPPILGTFLTDTNAQFSSLPFLPAVKSYTFTGSMGGTTYAGDFGFWFDGPFVLGYTRLSSIGGVPVRTLYTMTVTGSLLDGVLRLISTGDPASSDPLLVHTVINSYSLLRATLQGSSVAVWLGSNSLEGTGRFTFTATN